MYTISVTLCRPQFQVDSTDPDRWPECLRETNQFWEKVEDRSYDEEVSPQKSLPEFIDTLHPVPIVSAVTGSLTLTLDSPSITLTLTLWHLHPHTLIHNPDLTLWDIQANTMNIFTFYGRWLCNIPTFLNVWGPILGLYTFAGGIFLVLCKLLVLNPPCMACFQTRRRYDIQLVCARTMPPPRASVAMHARAR